MKKPFKIVSSRMQYDENPNVNYYDGSSLDRPMTIPFSMRWIMIALIALGCIIALFIMYWIFSSEDTELADSTEIVEQQLSKDIPLNLPKLISYVGNSDTEIIESLNETGDTIYERNVNDAGFEIIKLPSDLSIAEAATYYTLGLNSLSLSQAMSLLDGSWVFDSDHNAGTNMSLHYADFKSGTVDGAIAFAVEEEEFDRGTLSDSGDNDGYGNAYSNGTIMVGGEDYYWTVSALPLSEVYSIPGLPENAVYVGIRIIGN